MKFNEFAQLLYPVIGGASSTHAFVKALFDAIITEDGNSVLEEIKETTYKAYYNGSTGISRIARKIGPYIEPEEFVDFCNQFPDGVTERLCTSFQAFCPNINAFNVSEELAALFVRIIEAASSSKRKTCNSISEDAAQEKSETVKTEFVDDDEPSSAASEGKKITVIQHQTNVVQNGENNFNLTNNGTMNFNF